MPGSGGATKIAPDGQPERAGLLVKRPPGVNAHGAANEGDHVPVWLGATALN